MADRSAAKTAASSWDGKNYSAGAFNADDLKKHFGLEQGSSPGAGYNKAAGATDSDMTKDNDLLGAGYLSDSNYDSLKNSSKVKEAYAAINGQEAADKKFKDGGLSINALDGLFDKLTARASETPVEKAPEVDTSKPASNTLTEAQSFTEAYDDFRQSGGAVNQMAGDLGARDKFMENYKFNLQKRLEPGVADKTGNDKLNATVPENVLGKPSDYATSRTQERRDLTDSYAQKDLKLSDIAFDIVGKGAGFQSV